MPVPSEWPMPPAVAGALGAGGGAGGVVLGGVGEDLELLLDVHHGAAARWVDALLECRCMELARAIIVASSGEEKENKAKALVRLFLS